MEIHPISAGWVLLTAAILSQLAWFLWSRHLRLQRVMWAVLFGVLGFMVVVTVRPYWAISVPNTGLGFCIGCAVGSLAIQLIEHDKLARQYRALYATLRPGSESLPGRGNYGLASVHDLAALVSLIEEDLEIRYLPWRPSPSPQPTERYESFHEVVEELTEAGGRFLLIAQTNPSRIRRRRNAQGDIRYAAVPVRPADCVLLHALPTGPCWVDVLSGSPFCQQVEGLILAHLAEDFAVDGRVWTWRTAGPTSAN